MLMHSGLKPSHKQITIHMNIVLLSVPRGTATACCRTGSESACQPGKQKLSLHLLYLVNTWHSTTVNNHIPSSTTIALPKLHLATDPCSTLLLLLL